MSNVMTRKQKIQNLAERPGSEGEREAALAALGRLSVNPLTANEITAALLIQIPQRFPNIRVWRNNRIDAVVLRRGGSKQKVSAGVDGQADLSGIVGPLGRRLEIEVKACKDRMRDSQKGFARMITDLGGIYIVARDVAECLAALSGVQEGLFG